MASGHGTSRYTNPSQSKQGRQLLESLAAKMSLIDTPEKLVLWEAVQKKGSNEWQAMALWAYLFNKDFFPEKEWITVTESPPENTGRRRVDQTVKYLGCDNRLTVLCFHEAKAEEIPQAEVENVERQAIEACMRFLGAEGNEQLDFVYAVTSIGSKGRCWLYKRGEDYMDALFGSEALAERKDYVELHSSEARLIRQAAQTMRAVRGSTHQAGCPNHESGQTDSTTRRVAVDSGISLIGFTAGESHL